MGNTDCVRIPGVQFEFKSHSTQDLIGHFQWSVSSFSKLKKQGSWRGGEGGQREMERGGKRGKEGLGGKREGKRRGRVKREGNERERQR